MISCTTCWQVMYSKSARHRIFLQFLAVAVTHRQRKALLQTANRGQILALAELVLNLLQGNHSISEQNVKILSRYKSSLRTLGTRSRIGWEKRKAAALKCVRVLGTVVKHLYDNIDA